MLLYNFRYLSLVEYDSRWHLERCGAQESPHVDFFWGLKGEMQMESAQGIQRLTPGKFLIVPHWHDRILSVPEHSVYLYTRSNTLENFPFLDKIELRDSQFGEEICYYMQRLLLCESNAMLPQQGTSSGNAEYRFHLFSLISELLLKEIFTTVHLRHNPLAFFLKAAADNAEPRTVEEYAKLSHLSVSAFYKQCKALTGRSPQQYLQEQRLRHAQHLLYDDESITDIAQQLGYSSVFAFSKAFRKMTGQTPSAYRRALK
jgi:AraC-like DNA-binding protein